MQVSHACKSYGSIKLLENYDFRMDKGDHIAIVGVNGSGKSTFSRLISGTESLDRGGGFRASYSGSFLLSDAR